MTLMGFLLTSFNNIILEPFLPARSCASPEKNRRCVIVALVTVVVTACLLAPPGVFKKSADLRLFFWKFFVVNK